MKGKSRLRLRSGLTIAGWLLVAALFAPAPGWAQAVPGATYTGAIDGGGSVSFDVSADGKTVTRFKASDVPAPGCTGTATQEVVGGTGIYAMTITDNAFESPFTTGPGFSFDGSFPAPQQARGTVRISSFAQLCSGGGNWTASTPTPLPPPPPKKPLSAARLTDDFGVTLRVTASKNIDAKRGDKDHGTWSLTPRCSSGACSVRLHFHTLLGPAVTMRLARHGAVYDGTHAARLSQCGIKHVTGRLRVRLTVTKASWLDDVWRATRVKGTYRYTFPQTISGSSRCRAGWVAATITGSLSQ